VQTEKRVTVDTPLHAIPLCSSVGEVAAVSRRFHQGTVGVGFSLAARLNEDHSSKYRALMGINYGGHITRGGPRAWGYISLGILHNEVLYNLYSSPNIIRMMKSRRMR
jgi:hypothetical protein